MKFNISLLTMTLYASLCASDEQPQRRGLAAMRARLRANRGQTAPELTREQQSAPSARDLVKSAQNDSPEDFEKTLRSFLDNNPGCITWDESCESACPDFDTEFDDDTDLSTLPGFDQPISCKDCLGSCYTNLRGCPPEGLNKKMEKIVGALNWPTNYSAARCKITSLICQGADTNAEGRIGGTSLGYAAYYNDYQFAKFLLEHGASITDEQSTPLHVNMQNIGNPQTAHMLIDTGADIEAKDKWGFTPLMDLAYFCFRYSSISNIIDKAKLLFSAGAKTHHRTSQQAPYSPNKTAREIAFKRASEEDGEPCKALADYIQAHEEQQSRIQE